MLSIDFEQSFQRFSLARAYRSNDNVAKIQEFCHLFWLKYREEHSAKKAIISYVQEIRLRRDSLVACICHLVNMAEYT